MKTSTHILSGSLVPQWLDITIIGASCDVLQGTTNILLIPLSVQTDTRFVRKGTAL